MPTCNICQNKGIDNPNEATFDAPLRGIGTWAYVCKDHEHLADTERGTNLAPPDYDESAEPTDETLSVSVPLTLDSVAGVKCPTCGYPRHVEPDAHYTVTCEGCGQKYRIEALL